MFLIKIYKIQPPIIEKKIFVTNFIFLTNSINTLLFSWVVNILLFLLILFNIFLKYAQQPPKYANTVLQKFFVDAPKFYRAG